MPAQLDLWDWYNIHTLYSVQLEQRTQPVGLVQQTQPAQLVRSVVPLVKCTQHIQLVQRTQLAQLEELEMNLKQYTWPYTEPTLPYQLTSDLTNL